ncbi:guanylate-binding protein 5-like [Branchiostoma lanceolatum]|uniref:guanylate-binding protein 5-like n=1 Tax=Branchiostoma lanceolatum TaxID=7740 RepID=UPI0034541754
MAGNPRQDLFLKISQNLVDRELQDLRNYVSGASYLSEGFVEKANGPQIFIQLEKEGKLKPGDLSLLASILRKVGRHDFAEQAEKIAENERKGSGMDRPVKLTSTQLVNNRRQVDITPEAAEILSRLPPRPVDVVLVVGPMRKGKSHLANLLCKRKSGFPLGYELESATKDFWFWIGPHPVQFDRYIMVIDTEGLGDYADEEQNEKDLKYLVLATLFSNHLVFNLQGNLDHTFVSQLRLMGDLSEHVRVGKGGEDEGSDLGDHFPELWVAVQNTHLVPSQGLSPDEFLEDVLKQKKGHTRAIRDHNGMTDAVKAFFPKRHLRLISPPTADSHTLRNLDKVKDDVLQKEYNDAVDNFTREVWNSGLVKTVNGVGLKTTGLLHIMRYYVNAINDPKAMPSVLGAYEAMVEGECRRAVDEHRQMFMETVENTVRTSMPTDEEDCNRRITTAAEDAVSKLCSDVGKWDKSGSWKEYFQGELEKERVSLLHLNSSKSKALCDDLMKEVDQSVRQNLEKGVYNRIGGFDAYVKDMDAVYNAYRHRASGTGPAVETVLENFRTSETTRRNMIRDTEQKLIEEDRRLKEEERKKKEARAAAERATEAQKRAEAERAAEEEKRRVAEAEVKRLAAEAEISTTIKNTSYGSSGQVTIGGRNISYSANNGGFYRWQWVYNATAHDVTSNVRGKSGNHHSQRGAVEHAIEDLFHQLKAKNII